MHAITPVLQPVKITNLRPTQMTVGMIEVKLKRKEFASHKDKAEFIGRHQVPVVIGPKNIPYLIDHHHLARALHDEGVKQVLVTIVADVSSLKKDEFWTFMDNRAWCHPYNHEGRREDFNAIPKTVETLRDDPYRSVAGEMRRMGAYAKDDTPFAEFLWADFLRRRIAPDAVNKKFSAAVKDGFMLAKQRQASYLPGWAGPE